jgi:23S rRNA (adenine2503-C2)-methyltransferase
VQKLPTPSVDARQRLADYDVETLAEHLVRVTGEDLARSRRIARRAVKLAFVTDEHGDATWTDETLTEAGIGAWARPALLALSPSPSMEIAERAPSEDGTVRLLLRAEDGALVESVIIPAEAGRDHLRTTLCISSQVGCARACTFCETGTLGLTRQLTAGEIVDQYRIARRLCFAADRPLDRRAADPSAVTAPIPAPVTDKPGRRRRATEQPVSNIVFMGMGEPMDNLAQVRRAIALLSDDHAFAFAASRITVSTVGVADRLGEFFAGPRAELAISLNAPDDVRRDRIMPINERFDLATLRRELVAHLPPGRRVLFQYALFAGFNDGLRDADQLADYVAPIRCRVNVIPANPGPDPSLVAPSPERVSAFVARLKERDVTTLVRRPRGRDVGGACGQLAGSRRLVTLERLRTVDDVGAEPS